MSLIYTYPYKIRSGIWLSICLKLAKIALYYESHSTVAPFSPNAVFLSSIQVAVFKPVFVADMLPIIYLKGTCYGV